MNKKKILIIIGVLLISAASYAVYLYNKPHKNVLKTKAELTISSKELIRKFSKSENQISTTLIDKIIEISGTITDIEESAESIIVILDQGIKCEFDKETKGMTKGQSIKVKGIYSGFDEMFNEISLRRCYLIN